MNVTKISRLGYTLRHLKVTQLSTFIVRRGLPAAKVSAVPTCVLRECMHGQPLLPVTTLRNSESDFEFLHSVETVNDSVINWNPSEQSRLWRYHLHYFDMLRDPDRSSENKQWLIEDWIQSNPQGSEPAWEPYTASLRIVNWIGFFLCAETEIPVNWLNSLYEQVLWLEKNDERHILANHYFENIKSWLFAGLYFSGSDADRWLQKSQKLLAQQLDEQFLTDGGHYERSPHYHALMIENVLDLYNLASANSMLVDDSLIRQLKQVAVNGLSLLDQILYPGDQLPLFNDSAKETEQRLADIFNYGEQLVGFKRAAVIDRARLIDFPETGLYGVRSGNHALMIDCGDIGPAYQPGHTHCDFLSYELILDGQPVVVDSGLFEYQGGVMRNYVRSTSAHNTVVVGGHEQSEVWGEFRVARRAKKCSAVASLDSGDQFRFEGLVSGFPTIRCGVKHQRTVSADIASPNLLITIDDEIHLSGSHHLESYIHLHPDIELEAESGHSYKLMRDGQYICHITMDKKLEVRTEEGWYCPSFGLRYRNPVIVAAIDSNVSRNLAYRFERRTL